MHPVDVIKELESKSARTDKEEILKREDQKENTDFFKGCHLALDSLLTFGVKDIPLRSGEDGLGVDFKEFEYLAEKLSLRKITGNEARRAIEYLMNKCTNDEWNFWYRRVLVKDLSCGVAVKTINNLNIKHKIPVFACMLAQDCNNHPKKLKGKKIIDYKLDGIRVLAKVWPMHNLCILYSRNGKQLHNFTHIQNEMKEKFCPKMGKEFVFDGEIVSRSFQDLMKQAHRKSNVEVSDAEYHVFDAISMHEFERCESCVPYKDRQKVLKNFFLDSIESGSMENRKIKLLNNITVDLDTSEGVIEFLAYREKAIDLGYEGVMLKDPEAFYEYKRSFAVLKWKPSISVTLKIVDFEVGTGKNSGRLGAFICEGTDDGKKFKVKVGGGLSDVDRTNFWIDRDILVNHSIEIKADSITKSEEHNYYSLRFPRFSCFRGFAENEKL